MAQVASDAYTRAIGAPSRATAITIEDKAIDARPLKIGLAFEMKHDGARPLCCSPVYCHCPGKRTIQHHQLNLDPLVQLPRPRRLDRLKSQHPVPTRLSRTRSDRLGGEIEPKASSMLCMALAIVAGILPPTTMAASTAQTEMDAVLKRQEQTVEANRRKLDESMQKNQDDRQRAMNRAQRQQQRDVARSKRP